MSAFHPLRSVVIDFSPADDSISVYPVERAEVERIMARALRFPVFFDEEAARIDDGFALDDEFARRLGASILNALALSYPDLKAILATTNGPIPRAANPSPD
jgi:hypothetical protein